MILASFTIEGQPVAKLRHRHDPRSGRTYTPAKTERWETRAKRQMRLERGLVAPIEGPVIVEVIAFFIIPKSWPKRKREKAEAGLLAHIQKPDEDNVGKAAKDALNGVVLKDDCFIVDSIVRKRYAPNPRVEITIKEW
ncbi:MAG: RusA family crossover junction endodeoxyribonuclease [Gammaproteobacteria bacterium]|jgi:Holliday junction resolvase RusA-like endonuclease|nr:RusA family crossover junction endodeoxyribonuclease [Gammaproteobacteria bacterium]